MDLVRTLWMSGTVIQIFFYSDSPKQARVPLNGFNGVYTCKELLV